MNSLSKADYIAAKKNFRANIHEHFQMLKIKIKSCNTLFVFLEIIGKKIS